MRLPVESKSGDADVLSRPATRGPGSPSTTQHDDDRTADDMPEMPRRLAGRFSHGEVLRRRTAEGAFAVIDITLLSAVVILPILEAVASRIRARSALHTFFESTRRGEKLK